MAGRGGARSSVLVTALLALLLLLGTLAGGAEAKSPGKKRNQSIDREIKHRRARCDVEVREDASLCAPGASAIDMENCAMRCVSPECYENVYGDDPLEDGEVDVVRGRTFRSCARTAFRTAKLRRGEKVGATSADAESDETR